MTISPTINGAKQATDWDAHQTTDWDARQTSLQLQVRVSRETDLSDEVTPSAEVIPTRSLYPATSDVNPVLHRALSLLEEVEQTLEDAKHDLQQNDVIAADTAVQAVRAVLPELFCLRSIGDGYGAVINALQNACDHPDNVPFGLSAIVALAAVIRQVGRQPFMSMDDAVELIMRIEDEGMIVEPPSLEYLADWLAE